MGREKYPDEQTLEYYANMGLQMTWKDFIGMSESEYELYRMMYAGRTSSQEYPDEEETEQEHYAFDGVYVF